MEHVFARFYMGRSWVLWVRVKHFVRTREW